MSTNIKNQKEEKRVHLLRSLGLPKNTRAIVLSYIEDESLMLFLREATEAIGVKLLTGIDELAISGADAFITDNIEGNLPLENLLSHHVVPIIPLSDKFVSVFTEFNPMKFEGNAFLFAKNDKYLIFEKLVRYLENIRYPGDRRTLLQNIEKTAL